MPALPIYEVTYVLSERRLNDRRLAPSNTAPAPNNAALSKDMDPDRRNVKGRRSADRNPSGLKLV